VDEQIAEAMASWHPNNPKQYLYEDVMKLVEAAIDRAVLEENEACAQLALNPYGDEVQVIGREEPLAVGKKIAAAIRARQRPEEGR